MTTNEPDPQENAKRPEAQGSSGPETAPELAGEELLSQQLEEATRERDQFRTMAQRAQADFINYKRRMEEERQLIGQQVVSQVVMQLLPVLDDFQRAVDHLPPDAPVTWSEGVQMILRKLLQLLETEGVTPISPEPGATFDPAEQEAVYYEPTAEYPEGCVMSTIRLGYRNTTRVLRPAQVVLAQASTEQERKMQPS